MNKILLSLAFFSVFTGFGQDHGTGLIKNKKGYAKTALAERPMGYGENLPSSVNLKNYLPPIADQGSYGTCVGWSSTYYVATMEYAILNGITNQDEIRANSFDPFYTYLNCADQYDYFECSDGLVMDEAAQWLVENDLKRYAYNQLECGAKISKRNVASNSLLDLQAYYRLTDDLSTNEENLVSMKKAMSDKHPLFIGIDIYSSFYSIGSDGIYRPSAQDSYSGGHAMTMIGYDDNLNGGSFIIANSWGESWGDDGLLYMKYVDFFKLDPEAYYFETGLRPRSGSAGCVFGNCEEGYGRYVYGNGDVYEGDFSQGLRGGYGLYLWSFKSHFGGEWMSDNRHGSGYYMAPDNLTSGYWKDDVYNGYDPVENPLIEQEDIESPEDVFFILNDVESYDLLSDTDNLDRIENLNVTECVYGDCEDGFGIYVSGSSWVYAGQWSDGSRNGYGEFYWLGSDRGHVYKGEFSYGYRDGNGAYFYPEGNRYYGEWEEGNRNGYGALFYSDGSVSVGTWSDNVLEDDSMGFGKKDKLPLKDIANSKKTDIQNPSLAKKTPPSTKKKKK
jgi:hypothetical protein